MLRSVLRIKDGSEAVPAWQNSSFTCNFPQFCHVGYQMLKNADLGTCNSVFGCIIHENTELVDSFVKECWSYFPLKRTDLQSAGWPEPSRHKRLKYAMTVAMLVVMG